MTSDPGPGPWTSTEGAGVCAGEPEESHFGLLGLGWCLSQAGERVEAIAVLRRAIEAARSRPFLDAERDAAEIAHLRDRIKKLESVPRWITPIVIPFPPSRPRFGGQAATTALDLVDDDVHPSASRRGCSCLAASPPELRGLAVWHDRNRNGVSEHGEVRPVTAWGIAALSTGYDFDATHPHEIPWSSAGVRFSDGTVRPAFDVVLRSSVTR